LIRPPSPKGANYGIKKLRKPEVKFLLRVFYYENFYEPNCRITIRHPLRRTLHRSELVEQVSNSIDIESISKNNYHVYVFLPDFLSFCPKLRTLLTYIQQYKSATQEKLNTSNAAGFIKTKTTTKIFAMVFKIRRVYI